tara:strand:- start:4380 stop:5498 length:1119 start_codon:yes stop_codon:yes gene_type:complete
MDYNQDLFNDEALDKKSSYEVKTTDRGQDGLYRVDMDKVSPQNKNRGYRSVLRFLPNISENPTYVKAFTGDRYTEEITTALGPSHYEKITHYLNIQNEGLSHLKGYYDDPTNINPVTQKPYTTSKWGPLAITYFTLDKSKNALARQKAKMIKYSKKYFSYVLVLEDEQQPELVGKIMILSYGKQIKDIIEMERNGEISGIECNVFKLHSGKDFVLLAKNKTFSIDGKEITAPDYTMSGFNSNNTSVRVPKIVDGQLENFVQIPLDESGRIVPKHLEKITKFLLSREVELENFAGKEWTEEQQTKVTDAIDYLTGKTSAASASTSNDTTEVDDFSFDEVGSTEPAETTKEPVKETAAVSDSDFEDDDFDDLDF